MHTVLLSHHSFSRKVLQLFQHLHSDMHQPAAMCMIMQCYHVALRYDRQQMLLVAWLELHFCVTPLALYLGQHLGASCQMLLLEP